MHQIQRFIDCRRGATAIEYGVLSSLVGLALMTGAAMLGGKLAAGFDGVTRHLAVVDGGAKVVVDEQRREMGAAEVSR